MDSSQVVPTEDAVQALIDLLVYPLLPLKSSFQGPPSIERQKDVARQMHAVVVLYNYYHRKNFRQLKFLDFESFCKVVVVAKPSLLQFMKFMQMHNDQPDVLDKQFSITEQMIMDACNICIGLDPLKDSPDTQGWLVSKVVVFVVDSENENCLLQFSSVTEGVWSLIEKNLDVPLCTSDGSLDVNSTKQKKKCANQLQLLAFSAVKEKTGVEHTSLSVLESHSVYSFSMPKTTSQFYIVQCSEAFGEEFTQVPIRDVINSLSGPMFTKSTNGFLPTPVIDYFHLLPYMSIISDWFLRQSIQDGSQPFLEEPRSSHEFTCPMADSLIKEGGSDASMTESRSAVYKPQENYTMVDVPSFDPLVELASPKEEVVSMGHKIPDTPFQEFDITYRSSNTIENELEEDSLIKEGGSDASMTESRSAVYKPHENYTMVNVPSFDPLVELASPKEEVVSMGHKIPDTPFQEFDITYRSSNTIENELEQNVLSFAIQGACYPSSPLEGSQSSPLSSFSTVLPFKAEMDVSATKPCNSGIVTPKLKSENVIHDNGLMSCDKMLMPNLPLVAIQSIPNNRNEIHCSQNYGDHVSLQNLDKVQAELALKEDDLVQTAVSALQKKRDELYQQQRHLEDEIAQCEKNFQTILKLVEREKEVKLRLESIIEACNNTCLKGTSQCEAATHEGSPQRQSPQQFKRKRLSEAVLTSRNPCQELDDICSRNYWILPRYNVVPSNGGFIANVTLRGVDFECSAAGQMSNRPHLARESAAIHILSELRKLSSQV